MKVTAKNTGNEADFWVGISFKDASDYREGRWDVRPKKLHLGYNWVTGGGKGSVSFSWTVPDPYGDTPSGGIWLGVGLWSGFDGEYMVHPRFDMWGWEQIALTIT